MTGILPAHLRDLIIRPTLVEMGHYSPAAEALLLGTAAHESHGGRYLAQLRGPARGIYQMEPATHDDLWRHFLPSRRPLCRAGASGIGLARRCQEQIRRRPGAVYAGHGQMDRRDLPLLGRRSSPPNSRR